VIAKVCGLTSAGDLSHAREAGADLLGMIFVPGTPRYVTDQFLKELVDPSRTVGVFRNADVKQIEAERGRFSTEYVQLHGVETPEFGEEVKAKTGAKLIRVLSPADLGEAGDWAGIADFLLVDTPGGGTGHRFDWSSLKWFGPETPFLIAGGLDAAGIVELRAMNLAKSWAGVDACSRLESVVGVKNHGAVEAYLAEAKR